MRSYCVCVASILEHRVRSHLNLHLQEELLSGQWVWALARYSLDLTVISSRCNTLGKLLKLFEPPFYKVYNIFKYGVYIWFLTDVNFFLTHFSHHTHTVPNPGFLIYMECICIEDQISDRVLFSLQWHFSKELIIEIFQTLREWVRSMDGCFLKC